MRTNRKACEPFASLLQARVTPELAEAVHQRAREEGVGMSQFVREVLVRTVALYEVGEATQRDASQGSEVWMR